MSEVPKIDCCPTFNFVWWSSFCRRETTAFVDYPIWYWALFKNPVPKFEKITAAWKLRFELREWLLGGFRYRRSHFWHLFLSLRSPWPIRWPTKSKNHLNCAFKGLKIATWGFSMSRTSFLALILIFTVTVTDSVTNTVINSQKFTYSALKNHFMGFTRVRDWSKSILELSIRTEFFQCSYLTTNSSIFSLMRYAGYLFKAIFLKNHIPGLEKVVTDSVKWLVKVTLQMSLVLILTP